MNLRTAEARAQHEQAARWLGWLLAGCAAIKATGIDPQPLEALLPPLSVGLFGAFLVHGIIGWRREPGFFAELGAVGALAALAAVAWSLGFPGAWKEASLAEWGGACLGLGSLTVLAVRALRPGPAQAPARDAWPLAVALTLASVVIAFFTTLTVAVFPRTLDAWVFVADGSFGGHVDYALGRLLQASPWLGTLAGLSYDSCLAALVVVFALQRHGKARPPVDVLTAGLALTTLGIVLYFVFPVVGAVYLWPQNFPLAPPLSVPLAPLAVPAFLPAAADSVLGSLARNCMPSLHFAWALLVWWHTRGMLRAVRGLAGLWLLFTGVATLGFGYHYLVDLLVAVAFAAALQALCLPTRSAAKWRAVGFGFGAVVLWLVLIRFGTALLTGVPGLSWLLALVTVVGAFVLEGRAFREALDAAPVPVVEVTDAPVRGLGSLIAIFFVSGAAALVYEVVFARKLGLVFGNTATANTTVLATYMGGMALGSWLGGVVAVRSKRPLMLYAGAELLVGAYCVVSAPLFDGVRGLFLAIAAGSDPGATWLVALQVGLGSLVLLPPTVLMGATLPLLAHERRGEDRNGRVAGQLYAANTFGAALGALTTGYLLLPSLGVSASTSIAVAANLFAGLLAFRLAKNAPQRVAPPEEAPAAVGSASAMHRRVGLLVLGIGGIGTLALESIAIHLLATVVGSSAYAFTLMLFAFLVGLGSGSSVGNRLLRLRADVLVLLGLLQAGTVLSILLGVFFWESVPGYFASFSGYPLANTFGAREFIRLGVCLVALLPPTFFIGATWPVAMHCATAAEPQQRGRAVGRAMAFNTLGNIVGALLGGFVAIPLLGSLRSLHVVAAASACLALMALWQAGRPGRAPLGVVFAAIAALFLAQPRDFDWTRLATGANVYFEPTDWGTVIDHAESIAGGITTVTRQPNGTRYLLTNGKFQGTYPGEEMKAQLGFSLVPLLHTAARERAVVVGYGTGASALAAQRAGFAHVDVIDLTRDIVDLADRYLPECSGGVSSLPHVQMHYTDGRNFLALSREKYDLVGLEISSIWFAGAATLYNREFYALARERLAPGGVLQQWFQLHHLSRLEVLSIFETLRAEFEHVWVYVTGGQGLLVACNGECEPTAAKAQKLTDTPDLASSLALWGDVHEIEKTVMLTPPEFEALRADAEQGGIVLEELQSNDDNLRLEYTTPRANVRDGRTTGIANIDMLLRFSKQNAAP